MRRFQPALLAFVSYLVTFSTDGNGTSLAPVQSRTISPIGTADDGSLTTYVEVEEVSYAAWVEDTFIEGASSFGYTDTPLQTSTSTITGADGLPTSTDTETWTAAGVSEACQFDADAGVGSCIMHLAYDTGLESDGVTFTGTLAPFYTLSADENGAGATRGSPASLPALCLVAAGVGLSAWMTMAQVF
ncbi:hypothetical protein GGG16DRAFT_127026 [Schizophyllum commune]